MESKREMTPLRILKNEIVFSMILKIAKSNWYDVLLQKVANLVGERAKGKNRNGMIYSKPLNVQYNDMKSKTKNFPRESVVSVVKQAITQERAQK